MSWYHRTLGQSLIDTEIEVESALDHYVPMAVICKIVSCCLALLDQSNRAHKCQIVGNLGDRLIFGKACA